MVIFSSSHAREWILRWNLSDSVEGDDYRQFISSVGIYTPVSLYAYILIPKNSCVNFPYVRQKIK